VRSNGLPSGHTDLNGGHLGLGENRFEGVIVIKVFPTSFSPEAINNEATQDVYNLSGVGETAGVVCEEPQGVILLLDRRFAKQREGPSNLQIVKRLPFRPDSLEGFLGASRHGTIEEKVLRGFLRVRVTHFAL
jgi:hypothetical protein